VHRAAVDPLAPAAARAASERVPPQTVVGALRGVAGLAEGWLGAAWIACIVVLERAARVPHLYVRPRDVVMHAAAEMAAGACVWTLLWALLAVVERVPDTVTRSQGSRQRVAAALPYLIGSGGGLFLCWFVLQKTSLWPVLPAPVWWGLCVLGGIPVALVARWLLRLPLPSRTELSGALLLASVVVPEVWGLDRFVRHYGRSLGLLEVVTLGVAGIGARLLLARSAAAIRLRAVGATLVASSLVWLITHVPSTSGRRAVLVFGGAAKHVLLDVVWPLADRDGDAIPSVFWGTDPDDHDPNVTAVLRARGGAAVALPPLALRSGEARELLWIVVDTVRRDSFEQILREDAAVGRAFASFAYFARYETCSARTDQLLYQVLGTSRCDARPLPGGGSLLAALRAAGYRSDAFRYFDVPLPLDHDAIVPNDRALVARARKALDEPRRAPRLLLVHLRGGHEPYVGAGDTPRERYEAQLRDAFDMTAELVAAAPPERYSVVVLGDHGEAFGEHLSIYHSSTLYEEMLETPLLVRGANTMPGRRDDAVSCPDVAWQALRAVGLTDAPVPELGYDYAALDILAGQYGHTQRDSIRSLRVGDEKLVVSPQAGIDELYDLAHDPREENSLAEGDEAHVRALKAELRRIAAACPVPRTSGEPEP